MKIAMSADCFYPAQLGGPSNAIHWQAKALTRAGHDVTVVATSEDLPPEIQRNTWLTLACGRVIYTRNPHFYFPVRHIWCGWQAIREADIVHVNSLFYPASVIWVLMSQWAGKPVVWSPHGELSPVALCIRPNLKKWLLKAFRRLSSPVWFHATCAAETAHIRQQFGQHTRVVELRNMMELPAVVAPTPSVRPYLLFVGRLHPIKAIDRLLKALSSSELFLKSTYSLRIAGPDANKVYAQQLRGQVQMLNLSAKVSFLEATYGDAKEQLYANALVTILPSHTENFGNVVIESLAQGTPVIASTGTPWQLLETEQAGSWVNNDSDTLRQTIDRYLTMPATTYRAYRERSVALAQRDYDIMANVEVWEQFYEKALVERHL
jgi:glycosyltransferase involved in cell wall biosynthesis